MKMPVPWVLLFAIVYILVMTLLDVYMSVWATSHGTDYKSSSSVWCAMAIIVIGVLQCVTQIYKRIEEKQTTAG